MKIAYPQKSSWGVCFCLVILMYPSLLLSQPLSNAQVIEDIKKTISIADSFPPPRIHFTKVGKRQYKRSIDVMYQVADSMSLVAFEDTLSPQQVHQVRKGNPYALKGESPLFLGKILLPLAAITAGASLVISLFYIRS
jgi:hypothetical protein